MSAGDLATHAIDKSNFESVSDYLDFADRFTEFIEGGLQAKIIAQNENNYAFFQYGEDASYNISRPVNCDLFYDADGFAGAKNTFLEAIERFVEREDPLDEHRAAIRAMTYTMQQAIGCALDALPVGESNRARKLNGDLFERLIQLLLSENGVECTSGVTRVPVEGDDGTELFKANYQHDLLLSYEGELKVIGSVKTSSKDRIDKIFIDKFLYGRLTGSDLPHIAIFLNDVQRKPGSEEGKYSIASTFLSGHFKAYTVRLNPLDGVYYCDRRPSMATDPLLAKHVQTIDALFFDDISGLLGRTGQPLSEIEIKPDADAISG